MESGKTHKLDTDATCPKCGMIADGSMASDGSGAMPEAGDITVCSTCGTIMEYGEGYSLTALTEDKLKELKEEDEESFLEVMQISGIFKEMYQTKWN